MADLAAAADIFADGGGLDALAIAVAQQHQHQQQQSATLSSYNGAPSVPGLAFGSSELAQSQGGSSTTLGGDNGQNLPPLGFAGPGPASLPSGPPPLEPATGGDDDVPIPPELLEWDDTLTTAERVKLARRAAHPDGPSSSPQAKKAPEPLGKAPAKKKKKPKTTVGAVAAAAGSSAKSKPKLAPGAEASASSVAAAAAEVATTTEAATSALPESLANAELAAAAADTSSKKGGDRGKFKGLGRAWRKGLSISGDKLKTMSRAEIEAAVQGWVPPVLGAMDAAASGSGGQRAAVDDAALAPASSSKKPTSAASSLSKPKSSSSTSAKKGSAKPAPATAGSSSTTIPAKRKATASSKDEGKNKKSSKSSGKKTVLSTNASLSRGRNSSSPGAANGRPRSATADRHGSFSVEPSAAPVAKGKDEDEDEEEEDDALYCLCQEKYDEDRIMLACDMCEQWYHPTCVGLPEDRIELVGQFICPRCVEMTDERTTWKTKCQTEGCFKSAVAGLTKYCSTTCGETHLVRLLENAGLPRRHFAASTADAQPPSGACVPNADFPGGPPFPLPAPDEPRRRLSDRTAELQRSIEAVQDHLGLLAKRLTLLSLATRRADLVQLDSNGTLIVTDTLSQETPAAASAASAALTEPAQAPEPYNPKKKKSKFDSGPASNRVCGFDERLILGEVEWAAWVRSAEGVATVGLLEQELEPGMTLTPTLGGEGGPSPRAVRLYMADSPDEVWCSTSRKRCDAHSAWHKIRLDDFTLERSAKRLELGALRDSLLAAQKELDLVDRRAQKRRQQLESGPVVVEEKAEEEPMAVDGKAASATDDQPTAEDVAMADDDAAAAPASEVKVEPSDTIEPAVEASSGPSLSAGRPPPSSLPPPPSAPTAVADPDAAPPVDGPAAQDEPDVGGDVAMLEPTGAAEEKKAAAPAVDPPPLPSPLPSAIAADASTPTDPAPDAVAVGAT